MSVYGHAYVENPIKTKAALELSDSYGFEKLRDEQLLISASDRLDIFRLPPTYNEAHLVDIKKRVCFPKLNQSSHLT